MSKEIRNTDDLIDIRDVIERFEELETELQEAHNDEGTFADDFDGWIKNASDAPDHTFEEAVAEFISLRAFLSECEGNGGDEQWRGAWYPITCIRDSYFENYARELADDYGMVIDEAKWPHNCIDWERAARELQMDYTSIEFENVTYWAR